MPIKYLRINPFETTMSVKFGEPIDFGEVLGRWKAELNTSTVLGKDSDGTGVIDIARLSTETGSVIDEINKKYRIEIANVLAEKLVQLGSNMRVNEYDSGDRW
ncbi:hypothetical protein AX774_g7229 [Zancudomyces culisetae]|uniref:Uncharacterized protein n=1 Tax=Zancudomyces culisetae TaxID=1213189 RepID=A0A1R1PED8_ZANCU|nr:hypothetical protein AX774_g7229 [Zancudomyces culisetae]|eukprot:OMH79365.1 hypothetical protein AX774_g7229 [Zancudomyces culisetae]